MVSYIAKLLFKIQNTNSCSCDLVILIELLWLELSRLERLKLVCWDYHIRLVTLLPSKASIEIRLSCYLYDIMTIA